jgi:hypothetical protein
MLERPSGRSSVDDARAPSAAGSTTLAARKATTTISITKAKRFCSTHPRQSTW